MQLLEQHVVYYEIAHVNRIGRNCSELLQTGFSVLFQIQTGLNDCQGEGASMPSIIFMML
jgi:hypothetical protein